MIMEHDLAADRVCIAGGSGFLGRSLAQHLLGRGARVTILSRRPPRVQGGWTWAGWDGRTLGAWADAVADASVIVNLAGRSVDCIKTPDHCDEILRSRIESTRALGTALRSTRGVPRVWVQMSTAHAYGDPPEAVCDEDSPFGYGLAPTVARAWELAFEESAPDGVRRVVLRTSFVLGREGGALPPLARLVRWGLGGRAGHGRQGMSWIHEADMNRLFQRAIVDASMSGAYLATAPKPVSNAEFMRALRRAMGVPVGLPAAVWMVRIGAPLVMRTDPELALYGRYCVSKRLAEMGFEFRFADVEAALGDLFGR